MPVFMFAFVSVRTWFVFMSRAMVAMWPGPGLVCVVLSMAMAMMRVSLLDLTWDWDLTRLLRRMYLPAPILHASWVLTGVLSRNTTLRNSSVHFWDLLTDEHSDQTMQRIPQSSVCMVLTSPAPFPRPGLPPRRTSAGGRLTDTSWPDSIHPIQRAMLHLLRHARIPHNRTQRFCRLGKTVCGRHVGERGDDVPPASSSRVYSISQPSSALRRCAGRITAGFVIRDHRAQALVILTHDWHWSPAARHCGVGRHC